MELLTIISTLKGNWQGRLRSIAEIHGELQSRYEAAFERVNPSNLGMHADPEFELAIVQARNNNDRLQYASDLLHVRTILGSQGVKLINLFIHFFLIFFILFVFCMQ